MTLRWPWVSRRAADRLANEWLGLKTDLDLARKQIRELSTAVALRDQELEGTKGTLANMILMCRELEKRQRDLDAPPISSEDLEKLLKRHALVQRQLEGVVTQLERAAETAKTKAPGYIETVVEGILAGFRDRRSAAGLPSPGAPAPTADR